MIKGKSDLEIYLEEIGMPETPQRRESDLAVRIAHQEQMLEELRIMIAEHQVMHKLTDPAMLELVEIMRGAKLLKQIAIAIASIVGGIWAFITFVWDHVKFH